MKKALFLVPLMFSLSQNLHASDLKVTLSDGYEVTYSPASRQLSMFKYSDTINEGGRHISGHRSKVIYGEGFNMTAEWLASQASQDHAGFSAQLRKLIAETPVTLKSYNLAAGEFPIADKHIGFSKPENTHIWTEGQDVTLYVPTSLNGQTVTSLLFSASGFVTESHAQQVHVYLNDQHIKEYIFNSALNNQTIDIRIPEGVGSEVKVDFRIPTAKSPQALSLNSDPRALGIGFTKLDLRSRMR